ncbi:hypothetical protein AZI86_02135 [Bdellovibrio bacteriovorus]|uniref:Pre-toxin TG domain-containing protein n=1 Tax=Bdellovibrio bacteriovorus TaxID=959 RepID=A0A150WNY3_BDEBC|nr:pre-toxin TG domain-containing protein [Bdellovibrio bacteriovorus]KYG65895.1 hypothetical protein AZI86_02135 [Bdellovibrio bacteriovorus]
MRLFIKLALIVCGLLLSQCGTVPKNIPTFSKEVIEPQVQEKITLYQIDVVKIKKDMARLKEIIKRKKVLSPQDEALHRSLLQAYKQLKYRPFEGQLSIPPKTALTLPLKSYCLEGGKAAPQSDEVFQWRKNNGKFLYLKEILKLSAEGKYDQADIQQIVWGLHNQTLWENYPEAEQSILKRIDVNAPLKLPSKIKSEFKDKIFDEMTGKVPGEIFKAADLVKGRYYDYQDFMQATMSAKAQGAVPKQRLSSVEGTSLYVLTQSEGFDRQEVSFFNTTDQPQSLSLYDYYQAPFRQNVQAIAAYFGWNSERELLAGLEKLLYDDMVRAGFGFVPGLNDLIDLYEAGTGKNFFTDEYLTDQERFMAAIGVLAGSGEAYRYADKVLHGPVSYADDVQKKYRQIKNMESYKTLEKLSRDVEELNISHDWRVKVSKGSKKELQGIEFLDPNNDHIRVRVMPGKPNSEYRNSRDAYIRVSKDGKYYDKNGIKLEVEDTDDSHIPFGDFDISKFPWIKPEVE